MEGFGVGTASGGTLLPKGVVEITPHLYVGPEGPVKQLVLKHNLRHIVRCLEEPKDYNRILEDAREARRTAGKAPLTTTSAPAAKDGKKQSLGDEDVQMTEEYLDEVVGGQEPPVSTPSTVEEVPEANAEMGASAKEGSEPAQEICNDCGKPIDAQTGAADESAPSANAEQEKPPEIDWLTIPVQSYFCPMEDTLQYDCRKELPKAVEWIDKMLQRLDGDVLKPHNRHGDDAESEPEPEEEAVEGGDDQTADTSVPNAAEEEQRPPTVVKGDESLDLSRAVYVHCAAGASRSPTVIAAYLMARKEMPLQRIFDEFLPPNARPNPNFMNQLVALEESFFGEKSTFDMLRFNKEGLEAMFPEQEEKDIEAALSKSNNNVVEARNVLMRAELKRMNQEKLLIKSIAATIGGGISEETVEEVYRKNNKSRDATLLQLMNATKAELEEN